MKYKKLLDDYTINLSERIVENENGVKMVNYYDAISILNHLLASLEYNESYQSRKLYDFWGEEIK